MPLSREVVEAGIDLRVAELRFLAAWTAVCNCSDQMPCSGGRTRVRCSGASARPCAGAAAAWPGRDCTRLGGGGLKEADA